MLTATAGARYQLVAYELLDEPEIAARETMDEQKLEDLVTSIRAIGLLQPLGVLDAPGGRYRIAYGHRRYKACGLVPLQQVPCLVFPADAEEEALKVAENNDREELNAGEEALYLSELLERRCGGDVDRLCAYVSRKRGWVEDRLLLLAGDLAVLNALRARRIRFAVAKELNRVRDDGARAQFLDAACRGGATGSLVRQWREQHELFTSRQDAAAEGSAASPTERPPQPADSALRCHYCRSSEDVHDMAVVYVHRSCLAVEARAHRASAEAGGAP